MGGQFSLEGDGLSVRVQSQQSQGCLRRIAVQHRRLIQKKEAAFSFSLRISCLRRANTQKQATLARRPRRQKHLVTRDSCHTLIYRSRASGETPTREPLLELIVKIRANSRWSPVETAGPSPADPFDCARDDLEQFTALDFRRDSIHFGALRFQLANSFQNRCIWAASIETDGQGFVTTFSFDQGWSLGQATRAVSLQVDVILR